MEKSIFMFVKAESGHEFSHTFLFLSRLRDLNIIKKNSPDFIISIHNEDDNDNINGTSFQFRIS